ncbi:TetR/AcrR family transcriptional regulator [Deinococcus cavernae]|uniref:TetR/AcrR family transcriptional regulator n=1 Tax=Deinococcus cavernae TaxID=2320857 RepID=A0A418VAV3_9DEIO|nr:TetR/AcrR family transcriptional regulator [Deinococcus cavernae]RJF73152.1 TetR/AcrR family transcriptional regulator [Deinococcus cavernae]
MKADRAEQEHERRVRIARAAFELFARSGLEGTSAQDIARAAYVSRTNLYRYFPSKTHMLLAHFERAVAETRSEALRRLNTGANPQAVWSVVTGRMADLGVRYRHLVGAVGQAVIGLPVRTVTVPEGAGPEREGKAPDAAPSVNSTQAMHTAMTLVALVEPVLLAMRRQGGLRPEADTRLLAAMFVDACLLALLHGGHRDQREVLRDWQERFTLLMHGALAPGERLEKLLHGDGPPPSTER